MGPISFSYKYYGGFLRFLVIIITIYSFCHIDWSGGDHEVAEVNVVTRTERKTIPRHSACIKTDMIENVTSTVCLAESDQVHYTIITNSIAEVGSWERGEVAFMIRAMREYKEAVFVDGGCNIGMYTMMVAAMDRRVIAVDILQENIDHIKTSLQMMDKTDKVELVLNAISDGYETLYPKFEAEGGSSFVENERGNDILSVTPASTYIIKSDLQGYDCRALSDNSLYTSHFFIPYIHMEFSVLYNNSDKEDCDRVVDVLMGNGYIPYMKLTLGGKLVYVKIYRECFNSLNTFKTPPDYDVLWMHRYSKKDLAPVVASENSNILSICNGSANTMTGGYITQ